ncbi:hypothetical protein NEIMUCOT_05080 [Neisseria mucosa ATCC 25996]|uniref:Uncharacterized protein n=1 Tax=Neisseria mucosa (strain ATCC 25996 / DSM 4631 / NCTC 10774 / M26) TaxID=546266 RepID=D2ZWT2_NEIM2|nr:hypothetical protein NEIMUCOT_05080 [Neisseria mucosa ATCC 25996]
MAENPNNDISAGNSQAKWQNSILNAVRIELRHFQTTSTVV